jgi:hypothetical protein
MKEVCAEEWDANFVDRLAPTRKPLYDVILVREGCRCLRLSALIQPAQAANYMDIPGLLHIGCAKVAALIKGATAACVRGAQKPHTRASCAQACRWRRFATS